MHKNISKSFENIQKIGVTGLGGGLLPPLGTPLALTTTLPYRATQTLKTFVKRPLTLLSRFWLSLAADGFAPAIFGGKSSTGSAQMLMLMPQMTKPSHQAPIHRGSR